MKSENQSNESVVCKYCCTIQNTMCGYNYVLKVSIFDGLSYWPNRGRRIAIAMHVGNGNDFIQIGIIRCL